MLLLPSNGARCRAGNLCGCGALLVLVGTLPPTLLPDFGGCVPRSTNLRGAIPGAEEDEVVNSGRTVDERCLAVAWLLLLFPFVF